MPVQTRETMSEQSSRRVNRHEIAPLLRLIQPTLKIKLSLNSLMDPGRSRLYSILATSSAEPSHPELWLRRISLAKKHLGEKYGATSAEANSDNVRKRHQARKPYGEHRMIMTSTDIEKDIYYVSNEPGEIRPKHCSSEGLS